MNPHSAPRLPVLIIGAGLSGLAAARELGSRNSSVVIFEKARGVGGRLASRRLTDRSGSERSLDSGCTDFAARAPELGEFWSSEREARVLESGEDGRLRAVPAMTALPKKLARGFDVRLGDRVLKLTGSAGAWTLSTETGHTVTGRAVILSCPLPQSLGLLESLLLGAADRTHLESVRYLPEAVLLATASAQATPEQAALEGAHRLGAETAERLLALDEESALHAALRARGAQDPQAAMSGLLGVRLQRWRYSQVVAPLPESHLVVAPGVVVCGDAFLGDRGLEGVERAVLSGQAAARALSGP